MLPLLRAIRDRVNGHVGGAARPIPHARRRSRRFSRCAIPPIPPHPGGRPFPTALDPFVCTRYEIADFAREAAALGIRYLGVCCGAGPHHIRAMAEALGRTPPASRYSADMSRHAFFGTDPSLKEENQEYAREL